MLEGRLNQFSEKDMDLGGSFSVAAMVGNPKKDAGRVVMQLLPGQVVARAREILAEEMPYEAYQYYMGSLYIYEKSVEKNFFVPLVEGGGEGVYAWPKMAMDEEQMQALAWQLGAYDHLMHRVGKIAYTAEGNQSSDYELKHRRRGGVDCYRKVLYQVPRLRQVRFVDRRAWLGTYLDEMEKFDILLGERRGNREMFGEWLEHVEMLGVELEAWQFLRS